VTASSPAPLAARLASVTAQIFSRADEYYRILQQQLTNFHTYSEPCTSGTTSRVTVAHRVAVVEPRKRAAYVALCVGQ